MALNPRTLKAELMAVPAGGGAVPSATERCCNIQRKVGPRTVLWALSIIWTHKMPAMQRQARKGWETTGLFPNSWERMVASKKAASAGQPRPVHTSGRLKRSVTKSADVVERIAEVMADRGSPDTDKLQVSPAKL